MGGWKWVSLTMDNMEKASEVWSAKKLIGEGGPGQVHIGGTGSGVEGRNSENSGTKLKNGESNHDKIGENNGENGKGKIDQKKSQ